MISKTRENIDAGGKNPLLRGFFSFRKDVFSREWKNCQYKCVFVGKVGNFLIFLLKSKSIKSDVCDLSLVFQNLSMFSIFEKKNILKLKKLSNILYYFYVKAMF